MHLEFQQLMKQATQLTQSGDLRAATAAIKAALQGVPLAQNPQPHSEPDIIDVEAWEIPDSDSVPPREPATSAEAFIAGSFRNSGGQRNYKLYVPPNAGEKPLALVVMLHGCTQDADDFAAGTAMNDAARAQGFYVLYPIQPREANPQKCWSWFKHNHQQSGRGEPSILAGMTRTVIDTYAIDTKRIYVAGLSAGGAMAAILAKAYPDLYAAAGVHSGLAPGVASDLPSALSAMKGGGVRAPVKVSSGVPTIVFHGDRDATVHPGNAEAVIAASAGSAAQVEAIHMPGKGRTRHSTRHTYRNAEGNIIAERWEIHGAGHAWAGGTSSGSYTDQAGPDATTEMLRFFFERELSKP